MAERVSALERENEKLSRQLYLRESQLTELEGVVDDLRNKIERHVY